MNGIRTTPQSPPPKIPLNSLVTKSLLCLHPPSRPISLSHFDDKKKLRRETLLTRSWEWYFYSFSPVGQVTTNTNIVGIWSGKRPSIAVKIRYVWAPDGKFVGHPLGTHSIPAHVSEWLDEDRRHAGVGEGDEAEEEDEGSGDEAHPRLACYWFGIFGPDAIYILFPSISSCHNLCHSLESQVPTWSTVLFVLRWRFSGKAFQAWLIFKCSVSSKTFQSKELWWLNHLTFLRHAAHSLLWLSLLANVASWSKICSKAINLIISYRRIPVDFVLLSSDAWFAITITIG